MVSNGDIGGAVVGDSASSRRLPSLVPRLVAGAGNASYGLRSFRRFAAKDSAASRSASPSTRASGWNPSSWSREGKRGVNASESPE